MWPSLGTIIGISGAVVAVVSWLVVQDRRLGAAASSKELDKLRTTVELLEEKMSHLQTVDDCLICRREVDHDISEAIRHVSVMAEKLSAVLSSIDELKTMVARLYDSKEFR